MLRRGGGFGAQRFGFAIEFLHQEVQPAADGAAVADNAAYLGHVTVEPVELFVNVEFLGDQCQFDFEAGGVGHDIEPLNAFALPAVYGLEHLRHALANRVRKRIDIVTA